jgi:cytochrome c
MLLLRGKTVLLTSSILGLCGCGSASTAENAGSTTAGIAVYQQPLVDGNSFACATCHALSEPSADGFRRPGHPIGDATRRSRWKNGKAATFLDAVNSCVTEWMVAPAWSAEEPRFVALRDFVDSQAKTQSAPDLAFEIVQPPADVGGGNAARGRGLFDTTCIVCHGAGGLGTERGPRVAGSQRTPSYVARRIRTSGPAKSAVYQNLTDGVMPFWAKDRLTDDEVRDLVAFVTEIVAADGGMPDGPVQGAVPDASPGDGAKARDGASDASNARDAASDGPPAGCGKTHPRIGWKADLGINTGEGQVSGFVTMVDDCTLELTNFSYDGNGIDVRVYGSKNNTFRPGFVIGPDLFGHPFNKATLRVQLPVGKTLSDLDWVSIWCVAVGANFGSGPFLAP